MGRTWRMIAGDFPYPSCRSGIRMISLRWSWTMRLKGVTSIVRGVDLLLFYSSAVVLAGTARA